MQEKEDTLKKDLTKVEGIVELLNKPPHAWSDEELSFAIKMMKDRKET